LFAGAKLSGFLLGLASTPIVTGDSKEGSLIGLGIWGGMFLIGKI